MEGKTHSKAGEIHSTLSTYIGHLETQKMAYKRDQSFLAAIATSFVMKEESLGSLEAESITFLFHWQCRECKHFQRVKYFVLYFLWVIFSPFSFRKLEIICQLSQRDNHPIQ